MRRSSLVVCRQLRRSYPRPGLFWPLHRSHQTLERAHHGQVPNTQPFPMPTNPLNRPSSPFPSSSPSPSPSSYRVSSTPPSPAYTPHCTSDRIPRHPVIQRACSALFSRMGLPVAVSWRRRCWRGGGRGRGSWGGASGRGRWSRGWCCELC
jgi:hypothetical protein